MLSCQHIWSRLKMWHISSAFKEVVTKRVFFNVNILANGGSNCL